jgi:hypothetical protein
MIPDHIGDLQIFEVERVVLTQQGERRLVLEVEPLPLDVLMRPLKVAHRLAPAVTARLATRDDALRFRQSLFTPPMQAWIFHHASIGSAEKDLQPHINARLSAGGRKRLGWHIGAREDGVPPVGFFGDRDGLGCAFQRT